jgi:hypothetical protein
MGEFGWEVAQWIPHLHWLVRQPEYEGHDIAITANTKTAILYAPLENNGNSNVMIWPYNMNHIKGQPDMHKRLRVGPKRTCKISTPMVHHSGFKKWLDPQSYKVAAERGVPVLIGKKSPAPYVYPQSPDVKPDTLFVHARKIPQHSTRNYNKWVALLHAIGDMEVFKQVIFCGSRRDWFIAPYEKGTMKINCADARGDLKRQLRHFYLCRGIGIGGSSGPMHLMQHCKVPIVTWSGNHEKDRPRYQSVWNPFGSEVEFLRGWQPMVKHVVNRVESLL